MLAEKQALIRREVEREPAPQSVWRKTGGEVQTAIINSGLQTLNALIVRLSPFGPTGLRRFEARLAFGSFAADTIRQMQKASAEEVQLARALVGVSRNRRESEDRERPDNRQLADRQWRLHTRCRET